MSGRIWTAARVVFLLAVASGAWWSWREAGADVSRALADVDLLNLLVAQLLVLAGVTATGWVWRSALEAYGVLAPARALIPPFFIAQLGKYIPGSVWSFAAQGAVGARRGVSPRTSAAAAALFLLMHVASGLVIVGVLGWSTQQDKKLVAASLAGGLVGILPWTYVHLGGRLAGRPCPWTWRRSAMGMSIMVPVWLLYSLALARVVSSHEVAVALMLGTSFAVAHAAGILVPVAPAGLGAREGVLTALLAPTLGVGPAAALALLARLLHTFADFLVAGFAWSFARATDARDGSWLERPQD